MISNNLIKFVKKLEGFSPNIYYCPAGVATIGYGHIIKSTDTIVKITEPEATTLLHAELEALDQVLKSYLRLSLASHQNEALISFIFNIGLGNFKNSTILKLVNLGRDRQAASEFKRWVYCRGKILPGLVKRRQKEFLLYTKGIY